MLAYRYQDEDGRGPLGYSPELAQDMTVAMIEAGEYSLDDAWCEGCWHNRFPTPMEEGIEAPLSWDDPVCGASSLAQLDQWFPAVLRPILAEAGFAIVAYAVPDDAALVGDFQVTFDRARAREVPLASPRPLALPLAA